MKRRKRSKLSTQDTSIGSLDDTFYIAESWFKKGGEIIGKRLGLTKKQIKKKNLLLKNTKKLESGGHYTHSTIQRNQRFLKRLPKSVIDTPINKIRKLLRRFPKRN